MDSGVDIFVFIAFIVCVIGIGTLKSRKEESTSEDYFLAGRGLSWWLIGFSLIAANISTEQFVGMSGQAASDLGIAIASYEWMAAITLVCVAFFFLPKFLQSGIYTIPEFLEYRYNEASRSIMAFFTMIIYVGVTISAVIFTGALTVVTLFHGQSVLGIPINIYTVSWLMGILAAAYVAFGGLKACAWADLLQGSALIAGGAVVVWLAFKALGVAPLESLTSGLANGSIPETLTDSSTGMEKFFALNSDKLHMVLPKDNPTIPWTALVLGLWIPNFYYWGLNQYITQRTLGAKSLGEGQKGIVFAAALKLIIPFIIVIPGIAAFNLYSDEMITAADVDPEIIKTNKENLDLFNAANGEIPFASQEEAMQSYVGKYLVFAYDDGFKKKNADLVITIDEHNSKANAAAKTAGVDAVKKNFVGYKYDSAFGLLIKELIPSGKGLQGFMFAAILGAVISSLASMLNSASTIFTMDLYKKYINKEAPQDKLVFIGRICVVVFTMIGCLVSPLLGDPRFGGIFNYIQEFQGYISPGILAVFAFGMIVRKAPPIAGVVGLLLNPPMYGILAWILPNMAFLDRMGLSFFCVLGVMGLITLIAPAKKTFELPKQDKINLESSQGAKVFGVIVVIATVMLYWRFW